MDDMKMSHGNNARLKKGRRDEGLATMGDYREQRLKVNESPYGIGAQPYEFSTSVHQSFIDFL
jgi:hypothetical protein